MTIDWHSDRDHSVTFNGPRIVDLTTDEADDVFSALKSDTARQILSRLFQEPMTMTALSEELDMSVQNVDYHIQKLVDADLVTVVDTVYSAKHREMNVWGPTNTSITIIGTRSPSDYVKDQLSSILGVSIILTVSTVVLFLLTRTLISPEPTVGTLAGNGASVFGVYGRLLFYDPVLLFVIGGVVALVSVVIMQILVRRHASE